jgi:hypothetical protein
MLAREVPVAAAARNIGVADNRLSRVIESALGAPDLANEVESGLVSDRLLCYHSRQPGRVNREMSVMIFEACGLGELLLVSRLVPKIRGPAKANTAHGPAAFAREGCPRAPARST